MDYLWKEFRNEGVGDGYVLLEVMEGVWIRYGEMGRWCMEGWGGQ